MNTQRRIGIFISSIGLLNIASLVVRFIVADMTSIEIISHQSIVIVSISTTILLFLSIFSGKKNDMINGFFQFVLLLVFGTISTLENYESWYGMGLFILAFLLAFKYGYYTKNRLLKLIVSGVYIIGITEASAIMNNKREVKGFAFEVLLFLGFFFGILFFCYLDELNIFKKSISGLKVEKEQLEKRILQETHQVRILSGQIELYENREKAIDLKERKVTKAERVVLECLVRYNESNSDIARRLNKSEETVKVQMRSLFDKIGAENRYQLIDLCRNNFKDNVSDKLR